MKTTPYPVRLPQRLLELADLRATEEQVDRSTALRQLLHAGAIGYVLELLSKGRISLSKAAEIAECGRSSRKRSRRSEWESKSRGCGEGPV
jgi:1,6-anhydro-N-acetylmuramate kinase